LLSMKEREYFRRVCSLMIQRNRRVNFAAVIDNHGKLLFGQSSNKNLAACMKSSEAIRSSSPSNIELCFYRGPKSEAYKFFNDCLVPVIRLNNIAGIEAPNIAQEELIPLYDMISPANRFFKIGIISLNERKDRFLVLMIKETISTSIEAGFLKVCT
jgi:hypothetical protein